MESLPVPGCSLLKLQYKEPHRLQSKINQEKHLAGTGHENIHTDGSQHTRTLTKPSWKQVLQLPSLGSGKIKATLFVEGCHVAWRWTALIHLCYFIQTPPAVLPKGSCVSALLPSAPGISRNRKLLHEELAGSRYNMKILGGSYCSW